MFQDNSLIFSSYTSPVAVTTTADSSVIDLTGAGVGNAPAMKGGLGFPIGLDIGAGDGAALPSVNVTIGTTFTAGGAATLQISLKAAPQTSATVNTEGTYTTLYISDAIPVADLVAGTVINIPIPPILTAEAEALPRFYKLTYTVATGPMTAGNLSAGILMSQPNLIEGIKYPGNFQTKP